MRFKFGWALALTASCVALAPLHAKTPLRDVPSIDDPLMSVAIADEIRKRCDGISARMIKAYSVLHNLKSHARSLGYTDDEIDDYVTSKDEKKRMRDKAAAWLAERDVDGYDTDQLCAFGEAQIKQGGRIGELLR